MCPGSSGVEQRTENPRVGSSNSRNFWLSTYERKKYMSFDEKQQLDNDEIDLAELFRVFWSYKYILLIFIILSVPISIGFLLL